MSTSIETLIIALRDSRRRHLDARLERHAYIFSTARTLHEKGGTWSAATMEAANTKRGIDLERAASDAYHDCEELLWRLRWALKASDEPEDPATT
ncbi:MAG TPA: hypothetical protein VNJ06_03120 [Gemmatimonadales bacterium]|nr:hypothetical protein [Gemmatimonadales bacterium]